MKQAFITIVIVLFLCPLNGFCENSEDFNKDYENLSGQYSECAAYYRLVYHAINSSGDAKTANSYRELEDTVMLYALVSAQPGRDKNKAIEVTNSRIEMYIKKMKQETNNRNENISILINKYHFGCMELVQSPPETLINLIREYLIREFNELYLGE